MKKYIQNSKSWKDLNKTLESFTKSNRAKLAGDIFEYLTKLYLETAPQYKSKLKRVYLEKEVPTSLRKKLNLPDTDEGIDLKLNTKKPDVTGFDLQELPLDLNLHDYNEIGHQDCYERLLLDVIKGNTALFVRRDEVEASWSWIDNIINLWKSEDVPMEDYISGSWGPSNSDLLLKREYRSWKNGNKK